MSISDCPQEIIDTILKNLSFDGDQESLKSTSLVCRRFIYPSQKYLFSLVTFTDSRYQTSFNQMIKQSPHIATYLRGIRHHPNPKRTLRSAIWISWPDHLSSSLKSVTYLEIKGTRRFSLSILRELKGLKHLLLSPYTIEVSPNPSGSDHVPQLHSLRLILHESDCKIFLDWALNAQCGLNLTALRRLHLGALGSNVHSHDFNQQLINICGSTLEEFILKPSSLRKSSLLSYCSTLILILSDN